MHVGEVIEANGLGAVEEGALAAGEGLLGPGAARPQAVAEAMQLVVGGRLAVIEAQQFQRGAAPGQPSLGRALGGRLQHAGGNEGASEARVAVGEAGVAQDGGEAQLSESGEGEALAADGARGVVAEGVQQDGGGLAGGEGGGGLEASVAELACDAGSG